MYQFIPLVKWDLCENPLKKAMAEMTRDQWVKGKIGVAAQCWLLVRVELMPWYLILWEHLDGIQLLWVQILLSPTFNSYF